MSEPAADRSPRGRLRAVRPPMPGPGGAAVPASGPAPAAPVGRWASRAQALHAALAAMGLRTDAERYALASRTLGRPVDSLGALSPSELREVHEAAEGEAGR